MQKIFISYSHVDETFRRELNIHLSPFVRTKAIEVWHDRKLLAGAVIDDGIIEKLETCDIFLALISPNFIESDYRFEREFKRARERHNLGEMVLVPVILRACQWQHIPSLSGLLATPKDGKPITSWPNKDEAWNDVADQIGRLIDSSKTSQRVSISKAAAHESVPLERKTAE
jgi:hypothetical protein